jgi:hypothetical protein
VLAPVDARGPDNAGMVDLRLRPERKLPLLHQKDNAHDPTVRHRTISRRHGVRLRPRALLRQQQARHGALSAPRTWLSEIIESLAGTLICLTKNISSAAPSARRVAGRYMTLSGVVLSTMRLGSRGGSKTSSSPMSRNSTRLCRMDVQGTRWRVSLSRGKVAHGVLGAAACA